MGARSRVMYRVPAEVMWVLVMSVWVLGVVCAFHQCEPAEVRNIYIPVPAHGGRMANGPESYR